MLLSDTWGSIVVMCNELIEQFRLDYPSVTIQLHDWEAHANWDELDNADLVGPMSLGLAEETPEMIEASFAIGISTLASDKNLFRMREFVGAAYERIRFGQKMTLYDARTALPKGQYVFADGAMVAPLSRADVRPFQYVQCVALLQPSG